MYNIKYIPYINDQMCFIFYGFYSRTDSWFLNCIEAFWVRCKCLFPPFLPPGLFLPSSLLTQPLCSPHLAPASFFFGAHLRRLSSTHVLKPHSSMGQVVALCTSDETEDVGYNKNTVEKVRISDAPQCRVLTFFLSSHLHHIFSCDEDRDEMTCIKTKSALPGGE